MNLTRPSEIRELLDRLGLRPRKSLGQHFLIDGNILDILMRAADVRPGERVIEVGPGLGALTERLLAGGASVVAVEKDRRMADWLAEYFSAQTGFELLNEDALRTDWDRLTDSPEGFKAVSNLPYGVGSRILVDWVRAARPPSRIVVTVQREVGQRLVARPGDKDYGLISVWTQLRYDSAIVKSVSPTCFLPPPAVVSAIVRMDLHRRLGLSDQAARFFYAITRQAFQHRRKQLTNSLPHSLRGGGPEAEEIASAIEYAGLDQRSRPGDLSAEEWHSLAERLYSAETVRRS